MKIKPIVLYPLFGLVVSCGLVDRDVPSGPPVDGKYTATVDVQWPPNQSAIVAPLQFADSLPVLACKLNGRPALLLVDTGADHICLYANRLEHFDIENLGAKNVVTVTGSGRSETSVWSGSFTMTIQGVLPVKISSALCLPASAKTAGQDIDGIFSGSLMKALQCVIDLKEAEITFFGSKTQSMETQQTETMAADAKNWKPGIYSATRQEDGAVLRVVLLTEKKIQVYAGERVLAEFWTRADVPTDVFVEEKDGELLLGNGVVSTADPVDLGDVAIATEFPNLKEGVHEIVLGTVDGRVPFGVRLIPTTQGEARAAGNSEPVGGESFESATNGPPNSVSAFLAEPGVKDPVVVRTSGARISLQGKRHGGYLNWLVVRKPGTSEINTILLDAPSRTRYERLTPEELSALEGWFSKDTVEWTGAYKGNALFRRLLLPDRGGPEEREEWQEGYVTFRPTGTVWVVTCDHPISMDGPGGYVASSTSYYDLQGNLLCRVPHVLHVD